MSIDFEVQEITALMQLHSYIHNIEHSCQMTYGMLVQEYICRMEDFAKRYKRESPFYNNLR